MEEGERVGIYTLCPTDYDDSASQYQLSGDNIMPTEQLPLTALSSGQRRWLGSGLRGNGSGQLFQLERAESLRKSLPNYAVEKLSLLHYDGDKKRCWCWKLKLRSPD